MADVQFKLGDVVELKSGGPAMTVNHISEDGKSIECSWFDRQQQKQWTEFPVTSLKPYHPPKPLSIV